MTDSESSSSDTKDQAFKEVSCRRPTALPEKSKEKFEDVFKKYEKWCIDRGIQNCVDGNALTSYFESLSREFKASTLLSYYSMIRSVIAVNKNVDINKYTNVLSYLRRNHEGYQPKTSKVLTKSDVEKFLKEADDKEYLLMKVTLIIGLAGGCRREELANLRICSVRDKGLYFHFLLPHTDTRAAKQFFVTAGNIKGVNMVEMVRRYVSLRPNNVGHDRFFIQFRKSKCTKQPVGINSFGSLPKQIALYLKLENPEEYTGHCFKKSATSYLQDSDLPGYKSRTRFGCLKTVLPLIELDEPPGSAEFSFKHEGGIMGEDCGGGDSWNCQSLEGSNLANKGDGSRDSMNTPPVRERVMPNVFETVFCGGIQIKEEPATPQTVFESPERLTLPSGSNTLSPRTFDPSTRSMSEVDKGLNHSITSKISEHILEGRPFQYCGVCLNRSNEKVCFWDEKDLIEHCLLRHTDNHQNLRGSTSNNSIFPFSPWYQGRPVPSTSASGEPPNSPPSRTLPRPHSECGPQDVVSLSLSKVPPERRTAAKDKLLELLLLFEKDLHPAKVKLVPCESY